jgi:hypothetical protein
VVAARSALVAHGGRLGGRGRRRARRRHSPNAKGDGEPRGRRRLRREVDLTPEQVVVADSILRHEFEAMNGIREDTWPQMQAIMDDSAQARQRSLARQRERYHAMLAEQECPFRPRNAPASLLSVRSW